MLRNFTAMLMDFAAATVWAQSSAHPLTTRRQPVAASRNAEGIAPANRARTAANQGLQEMGTALNKMHALLKQMRANTISIQNQTAKANLDMWTLMVEQLDKQYEELCLAARQREELEARRAALYKQADEKAAQAAKKALAGTTAGSADSNATQTRAAVGAAQATTAVPASATSSN